MSCPRCGGNHLWDDNLWWGCEDCGYASGPDGPTFFLAKDKPGLARSVTQMRERGQLNNQPPPIRIVRDDSEDRDDYGY